ncbi:3',5'-cyclic-AMP phosphodiesterase [Aquisalimonas asiatica]|uniref:Icc protein n=1 Tax=Aquisalimonas asiatica TaxID=406100 RepID=A0A1H8TR04_9GAMM|nr:3',5'-cyclic-AMP phosphodiesterase [Aquisalimonas asiatica]SEO93460.1 Icc protein [Aquisalimonas asiatica]
MDSLDLPRGRALRVLQITDTHLYGDDGRLAGVDTEATCRAVVDAVRYQRTPADLLLLTGDVIHDGAERPESAYRDAKRQFDALGVPGLVIPGNHDDATRLARTFAAGNVQQRDALLAGDWLCIMLDSSLPDAVSGHVSAGQLQRLDDCLSAHPDRHALVCLHHQPVPVGCGWIDQLGLQNSDELFAVLDRHASVRAVVWGHVHQEYDGWRNGVRLLASPSTCVQFHPDSDDFRIDPRPPGYRWFELRPDGALSTEVIRLSDVPAGLDLGLPGY